MVEQGEPSTGGGGGGSPESGAGGEPPTETESRTLEVGFFFDGTGNSMTNAGRSSTDDGTSYSNALSNVALLSRLYPTAATSEPQQRRAYYVEGIGINPGGADDQLDSALGTGNTGVSARVHEACLYLRRLAPVGSYAEIQVDVFGFSRGAAAARYFVNCVHRGVFGPVTTGSITDDEPWELSAVRVPEATVRFVGIFDTVAAIAHLGDRMDHRDADNQDVNVHLRDGSARAIYHLTAGNEHRAGFTLNSLRDASGNLPAGAEEVTVPGAHSDVGGGYAFTGETLIPIHPINQTYATPSELVQAERDHTARVEAFRDRRIREGFAANASEFRVGFRDTLIGEMDPRYRLETHWLWTRPSVRPGLEKVAMKLMHDRAVASGVPFSGLPRSGNYAIPAALEGIYSTLSSGRPLSAAQEYSLRMEYIHWSAHFGGLTGADPRPLTGPLSLFDQFIRPHIPEETERRTVHPNQPGSAVAP